METSAATERFRLLVVDDLAAIHDDFRKILTVPAAPGGFHETAASLFGHRPHAPAPVEYALDDAFQGEEALRFVERSIADARPYALAFVDMRMPPGWDGLETIRRLWAVDAALQVVLCTAYSDHSWTETSRILGHTDNLIILKKPFDNIEVVQLAHSLTRKWQLNREQARRVASLDELVRQRTAELHLAQETFLQAFAASPLAQVVVALDTVQISTVNAAFERLVALNPTGVRGATLESLGRGVNAAAWSELVTKLRAREPVDDHPLVYEPTPGVRRELRCSARPVVIGGRPCAVCVLQDVTDRLQLEAELRQAQKMQAIGQLTAGIAHDFNNLLTGIQGYAHELLTDPANEHLRPLIDPINASASRGAALTRQLLVFGRKQIMQIERLDLAATLAAVQPLLLRLLGETIQVHWDIPTSLPAITADAAAVEQIVMNLLLNARDALPRHGSVRVAASVREFASAADAQQPHARAGRFIALSVADTGAGIAPEVLPRIFEPFFTTKAFGQGTGLGLSTVYTLVQQHRGWIDVRTAEHQGTTFTVYLPVADAPSPSPPAPAAPSQLPPIRVLAVDDDRVIRQVLSMVFKRHRIAFTVATDGVEALAEWEKSGPFGLVVTDIVMPNGVSGLDLARRLRSTHPDLPIVFITGYSPEHVGAADLKLPGRLPRVVLKPFTSECLLEAMLDAVRPPAD